MWINLKIVLLILGLGIIILPQQMLGAQNLMSFTIAHSDISDCCKTDNLDSCHSENSKKKSGENDCGDNCGKCNSCMVQFVESFVSPESNEIPQPKFEHKLLAVEYQNFYYSSTFQNIWQPPKIG